MNIFHTPRKFTFEEIRSWPPIHPENEIKVLERLLKDLEIKEEYEACAIVQRRIEALKDECRAN
jgi:protein-arginine kinase activator protein McsA